MKGRKKDRLVVVANDVTLFLPVPLFEQDVLAHHSASIAHHRQAKAGEAKCDVHSRHSSDAHPPSFISCCLLKIRSRSRKREIRETEALSSPKQNPQACELTN